MHFIKDKTILMNDTDLEFFDESTIVEDHVSRIKQSESSDQWEEYRQSEPIASEER